MKIFSNTCEFDYAWDQVTAANWKKYPNEVSTHVVAVDVLRRELDPTQKILTSERLITCKQSVPKWLLCLVGGKEVSYVREVSVVDLNKNTLTLRSVNLTMANLLKVYETVTYSPDVNNPLTKTKFHQEAQITAYATFQRICNQIEDWSVERFGENAKKGKKGFDSVLKIFDEQWKSGVNDVTKIVKEIDESIDKVKIELVKETDKIISEAEKIIDEAEKKILDEAEHVKKSIVTEYYDMIRNAFRR